MVRELATVRVGGHANPGGRCEQATAAEQKVEQLLDGWISCLMVLEKVLHTFNCDAVANRRINRWVLLVWKFIKYL